MDAGHIPIIIDDMSAGAEFVKNRSFYRGDVADGKLTAQIFHEHLNIAAAVIARQAQWSPSR